MLRASRRWILSTADKVQRLILLAAIATLAACTNGSSEIEWARAALERNPQVKVVSVDKSRNTIEVRINATGEVIAVSPGELAALPIRDLVALTNSTANTPAVTNPAAAAAELPISPTSNADATTATPAETLAVTPAPSQPLQATPYTVEREDGRVKVTGPGISIESSARPVEAIAAKPVRSDDPIVCDGKRLLRIDARQLNVAGDAIVVSNGCELHITNSRISAAGTALIVRNGTVNIANSELVGDESALDAGPTSRLILRNNTFSGVFRRDPQATLQDQGGNTWR